MSLREKLSSISGEIIARKNAAIKQSLQIVPKLFVEKNFQILLEALEKEAQEGNRFLVLADSGPGYHRPWVRVDEKSMVCEFSNPAYTQEIVKEFNRLLSKENLRIEKKSEWGEGRFKHMAFERWTISW